MNPNKNRISCENQVDQYSERCNDPLGRVNLLVIFLVLQTIIVIATLLDKTGGKEGGKKRKLHVIKCDTENNLKDLKLPCNQQLAGAQLLHINFSGVVLKIVLAAGSSY